MSKPIPAIPPHVVTELLSLWSSDQRVPSASSRREWSALRQVDPAKIGGWFSRKKAAAKKAGNLISEDMYDLSLDPPPPPPPAPTLTPSDLERKHDILSSSPGPATRGRLRTRKRIKIEELSSDIDTAYTSASTPFSDDHNTFIASSSDDRYFSSSTFYEPLDDAKGSRTRAYSHFSDERDSYEPRLKDTLFSPVSLHTNNLIDDTHLSSYPHSHDGLLSSSSLALPNRGLDSEYALLPHVADSEIQELAPNHHYPFIRDPSQKLCSQGQSSRSGSSSNPNSDFTSGHSAFTRIGRRPMPTRWLAICSFGHAKLINVSENASSYERQFERPYSSEPTLSALLSSDILFELLPFSDSQHRTANATLPAPVPATNFASIAFLYRLPNFPDRQAQPQYFNHSTEFFQHLESQVPLSDLDCDLSSFDRWAGDEAFEMKMTDEMLDELVRRTSTRVQSEGGVADEEIRSEADSFVPTF
ncbi:hypothetical protein PILCRDRAFT_12555 [Piloderma croceum F 1598]|uniref:Homeobox domain-containing protein n=1 Tax=Piloderma croceum (strain F 1598) TaxID=765440 RepID=A0A0C3EVY9_PILCF|nr:hypothetical protein PILCRDRAFT_12555 [Piloderma croceum F 1598]